MGKRGISGMVASVLVILMSIVAISILWIVVSDMIEIDARNMNTNVDIVIGEGYTVCDFDQRLLVVQVKRGADKEAIDRVMLSFNFEGNSYNMEVDAPEPNGVLVHSFDIGEFSKCFDSASVAPIFNDSGIGNEGDMGSDVEIPENSIVNAPAVSVLIHNPNVASCVVDNDCDDGDVCTIDLCDAGVCSATSLGVDCSDMIAWWRFDGDFSDETGNYDGVANGGVGFVNSGVANRGLAADFIGGNPGPYISVPEIDLGEDSNWTIIYWYNMDATQKYSLGNINDNANRIWHYNCGTYKIVNNANQHTSHYNIPNICNVWRNIALVSDADSDDLDAYLDSTTFISDPGTRTSSRFIINAIGKGTPGAGTEWDGQLDEMMIFDRLLSQAEIDILYNVFA